MLLVDSSVLIDFFRGNDTPAVRYLSEIETSGEAAGWALPLVCLQEVLQVARNDREWKLRISFDCRRKGLTVRSSTDCLIAALALERGDVLLHDDADFDAIARVRPLRSIRG